MSPRFMPTGKPLENNCLDSTKVWIFAVQDAPRNADDLHKWWLLVICSSSERSVPLADALGRQTVSGASQIEHFEPLKTVAIMET